MTWCEVQAIGADSITLRGGYNIDGALARFVVAYPIFFCFAGPGRGDLDVEWSVESQTPASLVVAPAGN